MKRITDLNLMTVIDMQGIKYDEAQVRGGQVALLYEDEEEINNIIQKYYNHDLDVDARSLLTSLNDMKTLISQLKS